MEKQTTGCWAREWRWGLGSGNKNIYRRATQRFPMMVELSFITMEAGTKTYMYDKILQN